MSYQDIKDQLKIYARQGFAVPPLNSKKEVLESQLYNIENYLTFRSLEQHDNAYLVVGLKSHQQEAELLTQRAFNLAA
jgi:hypothetical protein